MDFALHPNLAQIAASYDDICEQVTLGMISGPEARAAIMGLVARDDNGVQWTISPDDGLWYRRTRTGELVADTPPRSGIATASGWDLSTSDSLGDPRNRVHTTEVDPLRHRSPTDLTGSTIAASQIQSSRRRQMPTVDDRLKRRAVAVLAAVLLVAAAFMFLRPSGDDTGDAPDPSTPSTTVAPTSAPPGS